MKAGVRALGVAESYAGETSTLAGAVVRADRVLDGAAFGTCTVGGTDATDAVADLWARLDRPDVRHVLLAGVAPAWYNVLDLPALHEATERPVLAVTFEEPDEPLERVLEREFEGTALAARRERAERLPSRERVTVGSGTLWVRAVGCPASEARGVVRAFTPEEGRPEPLRVARLLARAGDAFRRDG